VVITAERLADHALSRQLELICELRPAAAVAALPKRCAAP
jgi:hypothetical protein